MTQLTDVADVLEIGTFVTFRTEKNAMAGNVGVHIGWR